MVIKFCLFFLIFFLGCQDNHPSNSFVELQRDYFIQENECGQKNISRLNVISINFSLDKNFVTKNQSLVFKFYESLSKNDQIVIFRKDHFFYPSIFNGSDHREYNLPECEDKTCEFEIYLFIDNWKNLRENFKLSLTLTTENGTVLFNHFLPTIKNDFLKFDSLNNPEINLTYIPKNQSAKLKLNQDELAKITDWGPNEIELVLQWRTNDRKPGYEEKNLLYKLKNLNKEIQLTQIISNPEYLAGMLMFKKDHLSYERKIEIINKKNYFYDCK